MHSLLTLASSKNKKNTYTVLSFLITCNMCAFNTEGQKFLFAAPPSVKAVETQFTPSSKMAARQPNDFSAL